MTITATDNVVQQTGNGVTVTVPYPYPFYEKSDLIVINTNLTTLEDTTLVLGTDYTIPNTTDPMGYPSGENITLTVATDSNTRITVSRSLPFTQSISYPEDDPFPAKTHEKALDKLTLLAQQVLSYVNKSLRFADTSTQTGITIQSLAASKGLKLNAAGTAIVSTDLDPDEVYTAAQTQATSAANSATSAANSATLAANSAIVAGSILVTSGDGNSYLANDGTYKEVSGGVVTFSALGTVTSNITLTPNVITTAYFSGSNTITLPTITDTTKQVTCIMDFTTATSSQPTITNSNIKWSDKNRGKAPSAYSTISGVRNVIVAKSIWISSVLYWEAEYTTYGGVETTFVRPNLTANGTLGGNSYAVGGDAGNSNPSYYAADGDSSTNLDFNIATPKSHIMYNPSPIKASAITIQNSPYTQYNMNAYIIYGSNDNATYTLLASGSIVNATASAVWDAPIPEGSRDWYKYYKFYVTSGTNGYAYISEISPKGIYVAT